MDILNTKGMFIILFEHEGGLCHIFKVLDNLCNFIISKEIILI